MKTPLLIMFLLITGQACAQSIVFKGDSVFTNKSNLSITVKLRQPLIDYLKALAPNQDSIEKKGNYQFSFYIDNPYVHGQVDKMMEKYILPAIKVAGKTL